MSSSQYFTEDTTTDCILMLAVIAVDDFILLTVSFLGINRVIEGDN